MCCHRFGEQCESQSASASAPCSCMLYLVLEPSVQLKCACLSCRDSLGIRMEGERAMQSLINVHFSSQALAARLAERPAMLYFTFNAGVIAVIVAHDLTQGEFVAQVYCFNQHCVFTLLWQSPVDIIELLHSCILVCQFMLVSGVC